MIQQIGLRAMIAALVLSLGHCLGQNANQEVGLVQFGSYHGGDVEQVDLKSGNLFAKIPLFSLPQMGNLSLSMSMILNDSGYVIGSFCDSYSVDDSNGGNSVPGTDTECFPYVYRTTNFGPILTFDQALNMTTMIDGYEEGTYSYLDYHATLSDGTGAEHSMVQDATNYNTFRAMDGSGYTYTAANVVQGNWEGNIYSSNGLIYANNKITDVYGNSLTKTSVPYAFTTSFPFQPLISDIAGSLTYPDSFGMDGVPYGVVTTAPFGDSIADSVGRDVPGLFSSPYLTDATNLARCPNLGVNNQKSVAIQDWNVPGPNGSNVTYSFCYTDITVNTDFLDGWNYVGAPNTPPIPYYTDYIATGDVIQSVILPNKTYWGFVYDSAGSPNFIPGLNWIDTDTTPHAYGDIDEIIYPTGGSVSYSYYPWGAPAVPEYACNDTSTEDSNGLGPWAGRVVEQRTVNDGITSPKTWTYSYQPIPNLPFGPIGVVTTVADPTPTSGEQSSSTVHTFSDAGIGGCALPEVLTQRVEGSTVVQSTTSTYFSVTDPQDVFSTVDVVPNSTTVTTGSGSITKSYSYPVLFNGTSCSSFEGTLSCGFAPTPFLFSQPTSVTTTGSDGSSRTDVTVYPWQGGYSGPNISSPFYSNNVLTAVSMTCTSNGSQACALAGEGIGAATQYIYGDTSSPYNLVSVQQMLNQNFVTTHSFTYDTFGRVTSSSDANNNTTQVLAYQADAITGQPGPFPAQVQRPTLPIEYYAYDDNTGSMLSHKDVNGHTTTYQYADPEGRLTSVSYPDGGSSVYCYTDVGGTGCGQSGPPYSLVSTTVATPNPSVVTTTVYDGLGKVVQKQLNSNPGSPVYTDTTYDALGRTWCVSNPYFGPATSTSAPPETCTTYDALGRKVVQTMPDSSTMQWCYDGVQTDGQANCSSTNLSSVAANDWIDVTDELGHHTQQVSDALGNLRAVMEQSPTGTGLALETDYGYDVLGNLVAVTQYGSTAAGDRARTRIFHYDSLSRLTYACNPEALSPGTSCDGAHWSAAYTYYPNSNLQSKTDNRGVTTSYTYDALNRLLSKSFATGSGGPSSDPARTPSSCYTYNTATNGVGLLGSSWTQPGSCSATLPQTGAVTSRTVLAYDQMGRVTKEQHCVPGSCTSSAPSPYWMGYDYDLAGNVTQSGDGIGQAHWFYGYNGAGQVQLSTATTVWPTQLFPTTLFSAQGTSVQPAYTPAGGLANWLMGVSSNGTPALTGSKTYDNRLRVLTESVTGHE